MSHFRKTMVGYCLTGEDSRFGRLEPWDQWGRLERSPLVQKVWGMSKILFVLGLSTLISFLLSRCV